MDNRNIFIKANKALAEGNYKEFITHCRDDIKWENVGRETFNGKAELLDYICSVYTGLTFKTENYIKENDFIIELGQITSRGDEAKTSN